MRGIVYLVVVLAVISSVYAAVSITETSIGSNILSIKTGTNEEKPV